MRLKHVFILFLAAILTAGPQSFAATTCSPIPTEDQKLLETRKVLRIVFLGGLATGIGAMPSSAAFGRIANKFYESSSLPAAEDRQAILRFKGGAVTKLLGELSPEELVDFQTYSLLYSTSSWLALTTFAGWATVFLTIMASSDADAATMSGFYQTEDGLKYLIALPDTEYLSEVHRFHLETKLMALRVIGKSVLVQSPN